MGGWICKEEMKEEKRSVGIEERLTSADRTGRTTFGSTVLSLTRRGLKVGLSSASDQSKQQRHRSCALSCCHGDNREGFMCPEESTWSDPGAARGSEMRDSNQVAGF